MSELDDFEKSIYVRDLEIGANVELITNPEGLLARVSPPRVEVEEVTEDEDLEELDETEDEGDGESQPRSTEESTEGN